MTWKHWLAFAVFCVVYYIGVVLFGPG